MLRLLLVAGFYLAAMLPAALIGFPWTFISGKIDFLYALAMRIAWAGVRLGGVRVRVHGLEGFDHAKTYIFMCNHTSNIDPPIVVPLIPRRTSVLVKKELFRIPLLGQAMRMGSLVPVDRSNREAAINSIRAASEVLRQGLNVTVFPEGTRSVDGALLPFKKGPFHLALESGVPVLPMTIVGTHALAPKGHFVLRAGVADVYFHPPVDPANFASREALMAAVRQQIASVLPAAALPTIQATDPTKT